MMRICISLALLFTFLFAVSPLAHEPSSIEADIEATRKAIEGLDEYDAYDEGSILWLMAKMHQSILQLTLAALRAKQLALEGKVAEEVSIPVATPNSALASSILTDISDQIKQVHEAEAELAESRGLMQALAHTRLLTEKVSLASLKLAYFRAAYGITLPQLPATQPTEVFSDERKDVDSDPIPLSDNDTPAWADSRFPDIDYNAEPFPALAYDGQKFVGWWSLREDRAAIDDSPEITAANVSAWSQQRYGDRNLLIAQCIEQKLAIVYSTDDLIFGDHNSYTLPIVTRIDSRPAENERWSKLISNKGAGLFGDAALKMFRVIAQADQVFLRITKRRGGSVDTVFRLTGADEALELVANTCGKTTLSFTSHDYRALQELLNILGYYFGRIDGDWGEKSKEAMRKFQGDEGLKMTGVPDRATLRILGFQEEQP